MEEGADFQARGKKKKKKHNTARKAIEKIERVWYEKWK